MTLTGRMGWLALLGALLLGVGVEAAMAQQFVGRIAGRVTDRVTGEPLPGANVLVEGTTLGAATDLDGRYTVLRVPVGDYTVRVSFVSYAPLRVSGVQVGADRTSTVDARLEDQVTTTREIVVIAETPPVVRDRTSTATEFRAGQIEAAPVEGVRGLLEQTAGVVRSPEGEIRIRGGGDVVLLVNGVEQVESSAGVPGTGFAFTKLDNSWKYDVNPLGVQAVEVLSGGFAAEYGNAQSGLVKIATKEGGATLEGEVRVEYRPAGQLHDGPNLYSRDLPEWQTWGDLGYWQREAAKPDGGELRNVRDRSDDNLRRLHALWVINHSASTVVTDTVFRPHYLAGDVSRQVLYLPGQRVDNALGVYDYTALAYTRTQFGLGGPLGGAGERLRYHLSGEFREKPTRLPTVERSQTGRNLVLTLSWLASQKQRLRLTGTHQYYRGGLFSGSDDIRYAGRDGSYKYILSVDSPREEITNSQSLGYTFTFDGKSYLEATLSHQFERYRVQELPVQQRTDPGAIQAGAWDNVPANVPAVPTTTYRTVGVAVTSSYQQDIRTRVLDGAVAYTRQVTPGYQVKGGLIGRSWDLHNAGLSSSFATNAFISRAGFADYYEATPVYGAAYLDNRLDFSGLVANLGLRLDGYNMGSEVPVDRFAPFYPATNAQAVGNPATTPSTTHLRLSPRFGLSFPIGERTAFRLQYGRFVAMPSFLQSYIRSTSSGWAAYGNGDLGPVETVQYETGVQRALGRSHRLDVVGYYNDRVSQIGGIRYQASTGSAVSNPQPRLYSSYANNGYGASFGSEVTLERSDRGRWGYRLSYSLSRTTSGNHGARILYSADPADPRNTRDRQSAGDNLDGTDRTQRVRGLLTYTVPAGRGFRLFGIRPLADVTAGLVYSGQSGLPYTYAPGATLAERAVKANNRRYPVEEQFDLRLQKGLFIGGTGLTLAVRIDNLFNHRWLTPLDVASGGNGIATLEDWAARNNLRDTVAEAPMHYFRTYRNVPRQVFFTVGVKLR